MYFPERHASGKVKLTDKIKYIWRRLRELGFTQSKIAETYLVNQRTVFLVVSDIKNGSFMFGDKKIIIRNAKTNEIIDECNNPVEIAKKYSVAKTNVYNFLYFPYVATIGLHINGKKIKCKFELETQDIYKCIKEVEEDYDKRNWILEL